MKKTLPGFLHWEKKYSHPDKLLSVHLEGTAVLADYLRLYHRMPVDEVALKMAALTHDIGKLDARFQEYLRTKKGGVNHADISAWFTYTGSENVLAAEAVRRHHTELQNASQLQTGWFEKVTLEQIQERMRVLYPEWTISISQSAWDMLENFCCWYEDISISDWLKLRSFYSLLVAADRMDALNVKRQQVLKEQLPTFSKPIFQSERPLDQWREATYQSVLQNAQQIEKPGVYKLTLPTGAGKTILGLSLASQLAARLGNKTIVYVMPFISIVEQNAKVAQRVFGGDVQEDHSLAIGKMATEDTQHSQKQKMISLFRYWQEPVVVTTLAQLWTSMFSPSANHSMNFHRLSNAVVILDEPQTLPAKYWKGFGEMLQLLSDTWKTTFLLMTATQPRIVDALEVAPLNLRFPYTRHTYKFVEKKYDIEEIIELFDEEIPQWHEKSGMVVLNTKKAALRVYELLKTQVNAPVLFLSGWMTPRHRRRILRLLAYYEKKEIPHYLVATQVVEAGVDVDFSWVFRDLGPLDSLIQAAGRCNRHFKETSSGLVVCAELKRKDWVLWRKVYDPIVIDATRHILGKYREFTEQEVPEIMEEYYHALENGKIQFVDIKGKLAEGNWGEECRLYDEQPVGGTTIFIGHTAKVAALLEQLENTVWELENLEEKKKIKAQLSLYTIDVPEGAIEEFKTRMSFVYVQEDKPAFREVLGDHAYFLSCEGVKENTVYQRMVGFHPLDEDEKLNSIY